jgi:hypothetical protein
MGSLLGLLGFLRRGCGSEEAALLPCRPIRRRQLPRTGDRRNHLPDSALWTRYNSLIDWFKVKLSFFSYCKAYFSNRAFVYIFISDFIAYFSYRTFFDIRFSNSIVVYFIAFRCCFNSLNLVRRRSNQFLNRAQFRKASFIEVQIKSTETWPIYNFFFNFEFIKTPFCSFWRDGEKFHDSKSNWIWVNVWSIDRSTRQN